MNQPQSPDGDPPTHVGALQSNVENSRDLYVRTLRTVALLVAACVLFVGTLAVATVTITSRVFRTPNEDSSVPPSQVTGSAPPAPLKKSQPLSI